MRARAGNITWYFPADWGHIGEYARTRSQAKFMYDRDLPEWADLSDDEKARVKASNAG